MLKKLFFIFYLPFYLLAMEELEDPAAKATNILDSLQKSLFSQTNWDQSLTIRSLIKAIDFDLINTIWDLKRVENLLREVLQFLQNHFDCLWISGICENNPRDQKTWVSCIANLNRSLWFQNDLFIFTKFEDQKSFIKCLHNVISKSSNWQLYLGAMYFHVLNILNHNNEISSLEIAQIIQEVPTVCSSSKIFAKHFLGLLDDICKKRLNDKNFIEHDTIILQDSILNYLTNIYKLNTIDCNERLLFLKSSAILRSQIKEILPDCENLELLHDFEKSLDYLISSKWFHNDFIKQPSCESDLSLYIESLQEALINNSSDSILKLYVRILSTFFSFYLKNPWRAIESIKLILLEIPRTLIEETKNEDLINILYNVFYKFLTSCLKKTEIYSFSDKLKPLKKYLTFDGKKNFIFTYRNLSLDLINGNIQKHSLEILLDRVTLIYLFKLERINKELISLYACQNLCNKLLKARKNREFNIETTDRLIEEIKNHFEVKLSLSLEEISISLNDLCLRKQKKLIKQEELLVSIMLAYSKELNTDISFEIIFKILNTLKNPKIQFGEKHNGLLSQRALIGTLFEKMEPLNIFNVQSFINFLKDFDDLTAKHIKGCFLNFIGNLLNRFSSLYFVDLFKALNFLKNMNYFNNNIYKFYEIHNIQIPKNLLQHYTIPFLYKVLQHYASNTPHYNVIKNAKEVFKDCNGFSSKLFDYLIDLDLTKSEKINDVLTVKGHLYEILVALELNKNGDTVLGFGSIYPLKEDNKFIEFDIETPDTLIECKNINWNTLTNDHKNVLKEQFIQGSKCAKSYNKQYLVYTNTIVSQEFKNFFEQNKIKYKHWYTTIKVL